MMIKSLLVVIVFGFGVLIGAVLESIVSSGEDGIECPPAVEAASRMALFYPGDFPETTEADIEFAELCGFPGWAAPIKWTPE